MDTDIIANFHGVEVLNAPIFGPRMILSLQEERYEGPEIKAGLAAIPAGARLLELGAGSGVVGAALNKKLDLAATLSVEANPNLFPFITRLHAHNGLAEKIRLRYGVVLSDPAAPATVTFHLRGNFLGSSLIAPEAGKVEPVEVPVIRYEDLKAEFPHDAIMMDIEGGELEFLRHADLSGVDVFVAEFHKDIYGREGKQECVKLLRRAGLRLDKDLSMRSVMVFRRDAATAAEPPETAAEEAPPEVEG